MSTLWEVTDIQNELILILWLADICMTHLEGRHNTSMPSRVPNGFWRQPNSLLPVLPPHRAHLRAPWWRASSQWQRPEIKRPWRSAQTPAPSGWGSVWPPFRGDSPGLHLNIGPQRLRLGSRMASTADTQWISAICSLSLHWFTTIHTDILL